MMEKTLRRRLSFQEKKRSRHLPKRALARIEDRTEEQADKPYSAAGRSPAQESRRRSGALHQSISPKAKFLIFEARKPMSLLPSCDEKRLPVA